MIKAEPKVVVFDSIEPGKLYLMTLAITNTSNIAQRIRIKAPTTEYFALNYIPTKCVAPGLDIRAEVECQLPIDSSIGYTDRLIVRMGDSTLEIPIIASKPHSVLVHNSFVNFGTLPVGSHMQAKINFRNEGRVAGTVTFKPRNKSNLLISPSSIDLNPNESGEAVVSFTGNAPVGSYREVIEVNMSDALKTTSAIDIIATILESKLTLVGPKNSGILQNIDLGLVYYGNERTLQATLINSGPVPLSYEFKEIIDEALQTSNAPEYISSNKSSFLTITPSSSTVEPFTETPITIKFRPELIRPDRGFTKEYNDQIRVPQSLDYYMRLECVETGFQHNFFVQSTVVNPTLQFDISTLYFGSCPSNDRRDARIALSSHSPTPLEFSFSSHPYFKVSPNSGRILQYQSIPIVVTFLPLQLGKFIANIELTVKNSPTSKISLAVHGECNQVGARKILIGGTNKLPEDFQVSYKFIDQDIEKAKFLKSENITPSNAVTSSLKITHLAKTLSSELSILTASTDTKAKKLNMATESRKLVEAGERAFAFDRHRREQLAIQEKWESKKLVDKQYNEYLSNSYVARTQRALSKNKEKYRKMKEMDDIVLDY